MVEYQAAFADVDEITVNTQSAAAKGAPTGVALEAYLDAVTEWSDGKIKFNIEYANAIAEPLEADDALADGRLDLAVTYPAQEPSEYPAMAALNDIALIADQGTITGPMQSMAWVNEVALSTKAILDEAEEHGLKSLVSFDAGPTVAFCREDGRRLADWKGRQIRGAAAAELEQVTALGGEGVSLPITETFEALQRGTVDCVLGPVAVGSLLGILPDAPHITVDPQAGFALGGGVMSFSQAKWEELPLVAQQLFWDRFDVHMKANLQGRIWPEIVAASEEIRKHGGEFQPLDSEARAVLQAKNDEIVKKIGSREPFGAAVDIVAEAQSAAKKWSTIISDLGYENVADYDTFEDSYSPDAIDLDAFVERVGSEIYSDARPR